MTVSESKVVFVAVAIVVGVSLWRWLKTCMGQPVTPDPWGLEVAEALEHPDATPICPHCQCPHEVNRWFCPECGRAAGECTNLMPPLYVFSVGSMLRDGIRNGAHLGPFRTAGSIAVAAAAYLVVTPYFLSKAAPFMWLALLGFPVGLVLCPLGIGLFVTYLVFVFNAGGNPEADNPDSTGQPPTAS